MQAARPIPQSSHFELPVMHTASALSVKMAAAMVPSGYTKACARCCSDSLRQLVSCGQHVYECARTCLVLRGMCLPSAVRCWAGWIRGGWMRGAYVLAEHQCHPQGAYTISAAVQLGGWAPANKTALASNGIDRIAYTSEMLLILNINVSTGAVQKQHFWTAHVNLSQEVAWGGWVEGNLTSLDPQSSILSWALIQNYEHVIRIQGSRPDEWHSFNVNWMKGGSLVHEKDWMPCAQGCEQRLAWRQRCSKLNQILRIMVF
eukprot:1158924-Pelagomonas_calceolata.AAC.10